MRPATIRPAPARPGGARARRSPARRRLGAAEGDDAAGAFYNAAGTEPGDRRDGRLPAGADRETLAAEAET